MEKHGAVTQAGAVGKRGAGAGWRDGKARRGGTGWRDGEAWCWCRLARWGSVVLGQADAVAWLADKLADSV